jgi:sulfite reductase (NADPH) flavoprotein alpha-component
VKVTVNRRLTPLSYERNVFHVEFDTTGTHSTITIICENVTQFAGTGLKYEIGEALAVHGHNDIEHVKDFLKFYGLNPQDIVALPFKASQHGQVHIKTIEQIFTQYLCASFFISGPIS